MNAPLSMTVSEWLASAESSFRTAGIESARLDALLLLSDELGRDKTWLLAYSDFELQGSKIKNLSTKVAQRSQHIPLAYIRGTVEFYGHSFAVNPDVLVPRPESEAFLELLLSLNDDAYTSIIDVGTGSGALAISAKLLTASSNVYATDISPKALQVARQNAQQHKANITFLLGNLLEPLTDEILLDSVLLCNLPYVPDDYPINKAATHEPKLALFSGKEGLEHYHLLFDQIAKRSKKPKYMLTESLRSQHTLVEALALESNYTLLKTVSLVQLFVRD